MRQKIWAAGLAAILVLAGCASNDDTEVRAEADEAATQSDDHGHSHGDDHGHSHGDDDGAQGDAAMGKPAPDFVSGTPVPEMIREGERHFAKMYQLTRGGENAEAYFSWDNTQLILQVTDSEAGCDQIYTLPTRGGHRKLVSTGKGRTTCSYFFPGDEKILYSSTHHHDPNCPPKPDYSRGYVWPIYSSYEIFTANPDGSNLQQLTDTPGYNAEATIGPDGTIVFTSMRDGDLDIYTMAEDGSDVRRLTDTPGYDGGPFFSPDGSMICYRAHHPAEGPALEEYQALLAEDLIRPGELDIYVMNRDGSGKKRLTENGAANFGPFFHPSGEKVVFASNLNDDTGRNFDLFMVGLDGGTPEQITFEESFDGFPMFSHDGRYLVFASNRGGQVRGETNVFLAEWQD